MDFVGMFGRANNELVDRRSLAPAEPIERIEPADATESNDPADHRDANDAIEPSENAEMSERRLRWDHM